jgi:hypothetical protein
MFVVVFREQKAAGNPKRPKRRNAKRKTQSGPESSRKQAEKARTEQMID